MLSRSVSRRAFVVGLAAASGGQVVGLWSGLGPRVALAAPALQEGDGGRTWQQASFVEPQLGRDTWVRWQGTFDLPAGTTLTLVSRATDGTGQLQTRQEVPPQPDGASGWRRIEVTGG